MAGRLRVGWATSAWQATPRPTVRGLPAAVAMRSANVARWIDRHDRRFRTELYRPERRYDVVVFVKAMDEAAQREAERVSGYGGRVVFDANVNYYEVWGEYDVAGTEPTPEQQEQAIAITQLADWVVADSSYLLGIVRKHTDRASWIPDNVDTRLFRPPRRAPRRSGPLRLVWSGMAHKARHLLVVRDVLSSLEGVELLVASNERPEALAELQDVAPCRFEQFSLRGYVRLLRDRDVIISPKRLNNGYELGHSEWKITLGMAAGLPAVASPQPSYVEAIEHRGGGIVADGDDEWRAALERLRDSDLRDELGRRARETVLERYATPVVARQYADLLGALS
jgi:glycosyltransferase involved in cell wall biosynthesis